jgi:parallel beta-helix repeat protein
VRRVRFSCISGFQFDATGIFFGGAAAGEGRARTTTNAAVNIPMKSLQFFGLGIVLAVLACLAGCTNPKPNPLEPPPKFRDGYRLDTSATEIAPSDKPYVVVHDWIIPVGRTVTILPGTEIMFDSLWWVDVQGRIVAEGTVENPIVFTTAYLNPNRGQWRGFKLRHSPDGESSFRNCIFTYGAFYDTDTLKMDPVETPPIVESLHFRGMLCVRNSSPVIQHCVVYYNQNNAVSLSGANCAPRIRYNIFTKNDASAVRADTLVPIANSVGEAGKPDVSYNCVADNSSIPFVYGFDSTRFGRKVKSNANRDSVDFFYNLDKLPLMVDPVNNDFTLQSCSPCVDAGPAGEDLDFDGTRADMGSNPYVQVAGELRGLLEVDTLHASVTYRMSCDCKVDSGRTLYVEAGTQIEAVGLYVITVAGRVVMTGSEGARVRILPIPPADTWGGLELTNFDSLGEPSLLQYVDMVQYQRMDVSKAGTRFDHCRFEEGFFYGVHVATYAADESDTVSFQSCTFESCGENAVLADTSAVTVRNTLISGSRGRGITLRGTGSAAVTNCLIRGGGSSGIMLQDFANPTVTNNTIGNNGYFGMQLVNNCNPLIQNNIIVSNQRYGVYAQYSSVPVLQFNDVWGHSANTDSGAANTDYVPASLVRSNSISADPLFLAADDWRLAEGSPCVDTGNPSAEFNDPDGSPNDMGAFGGPAASLGLGAVRWRGPVAARLAMK